MEDLKKENERLKKELEAWKKDADEGKVRPCRDEGREALFKTAGLEAYCLKYPFDPRCVKTFSKNPVTKHLDVVMDADSPYYDEKSAKCLFGAQGIDYKVERKITKKEDKEKKEKEE